MFRLTMIALFVVLSCLIASPAMADHGCAGGSCGLRPGRAAAGVVRGVASRRPLRRAFGRLFRR